MSRLLVLLSIIATSAWAKQTVGKVRLSSQDTEQYLCKFSLSNGAKGRVALMLKSDDEQKPYLDGHMHSLQVAAFHDEDWSKFQKSLSAGSLCQDRLQYASWTQSVPTSSTGVYKFAKEFQPKERSHYWYLLLVDCYLEEYNAHPPAMHFEATFLNNGLQLPADEQGLPNLYTALLLIMLCFGAIFMKMACDQFGELGQLHVIVFLLFAAFVLQLVAVLLEVMHLSVYQIDGRGLRWSHTYFAADFLAEVAQTLSETLLMFVLVCLSFGWTLGVAVEVSSTPASRFFAHFSRHSLLFLAVLGLLQLVLELLGARYEDNQNSFHDFSHWPGYCMLAIRLALCGAFLYGLWNTRRVEGDQVRKFMFMLRLLGTLWFVSFPLLVLLSGFVSEHSRHAFVTGSAVTMQSLAIAGLTAQFLRKSTYFKISSLSQMGTIFGSNDKFATE